MITITLEDGQVIVAEKLIGTAFRGGEVIHIVDGPADLVDVEIVADIMERHKRTIVKGELERRKAAGSNPSIVLASRQ